MHDTASPDDLGLAVGALIDLGGTLSQMVAHMADAPRRAGPAGQAVVPIPDVLQSLLTGTLRPVADELSPAALADVAAFLSRASTTLAEEIFLVPHDRPLGPPRNRAARRRRR